MNEQDKIIDLLCVLEEVRECCLFDDDDGMIGVTTDPHISEDLFDKINEIIVNIRKEI